MIHTDVSTIAGPSDIPRPRDRPFEGRARDNQGASVITRWDVTRAVRDSNLPAPGRHIMLTLADVAEVGTAEIPPQRTPSESVLARETGLNRSTVQRHLRALDKAGWIVRHRPDVAAQLRGERVRYALRIGAPTYLPDGVENDQPGRTGQPAVAAQEGQPGRTGQPAVAAQEGQPGRTGRPSKRTYVFDGVDTPLPPAAPEPPDQVEAPGEEEKTIITTPGQTEAEAALVADILATRPEWSAVQIRSALDECSVRERPWPIVAAAMRLVAADHRSTSPGRLRAPGPWWAEAAAAVRRSEPQARPVPRALPAIVAAERAAVTGTARAARAAAARAALASGGAA